MSSSRRKSDTNSYLITVQENWAIALREAAKEAHAPSPTEYIRGLISQDRRTRRAAIRLGLKLPALRTVLRREKSKFRDRQFPGLKQKTRPYDRMTREERLEWIQVAPLQALCNLNSRLNDETIETVIAHTAPRDELEAALAKVIQALTPYPAIAIAPWFWTTKAGVQVAEAQWALHGGWVKDGGNALTLSDASRLLWGDATKTHLSRIEIMVREQKLQMFTNPYVQLKGQHKNYVLRTEILKIIETGNYYLSPGEKKERDGK